VNDNQVHGLQVFFFDNIRDNMDIKKMEFLEFQKKRYDKRFIKMVTFSQVIFNGERVVSVEITPDMLIIIDTGNLNYFNQHVHGKQEIFAYNHEGADTTVEILFQPDPPRPSIHLTFLNLAQTIRFVELVRMLLNLSSDSGSQSNSSEEVDSGRGSLASH
jgi:hypothetical protein